MLHSVQHDEETLLREASDINFDKIKLSIKRSGVLQGVLRLLMLKMSASVTKQLGMAPGGEFRRAVKEAEQVPGCEITLGDRPIDVRSVTKIIIRVSQNKGCILFKNQYF